MLPSLSEYEILRPLYRGETQKLDEVKYHDTIEFLLSNHMIKRIEVKNNTGLCVETLYCITTLGKRAYEECLNYLIDEGRKHETLKTAKNANKISITAIVISALSCFVALASLLISILL